MASERRIERLQSVIERETSAIFQKGLNDPRIGPVVVTRVKLSRDLRYCTIYVNPRGNQVEKKTTIRGLNSADGVVQGKLAQILQLRYTPQIQFEIDKGIEKAIEVNKLLDQISKERHAETKKSCQSDI